MKKKTKNSRSKEARVAKFIKMGEAKYGKGTYDYSMAAIEYKTNRIQIHLKCNRCDSKPFLVYPFRHTQKGDNQRGTCQKCYVPENNISENRWIPNLPQRIKAFKKKAHAKFGDKYLYPHFEKEYTHYRAPITVICTGCGDMYSYQADSITSKTRIGGCKICTKAAMAETIAKKNKARQERNHQTSHLPKAYGCIYKITHRKDGKFYIGYTTMTAKKRLKSHCDEARRLARGYQKAKSYLHNAMSKHGCENFSVEVLIDFTNVSPLKLGELEKYYIETLEPHYNVSPGGELGYYGKAG